MVTLSIVFGSSWFISIGIPSTNTNGSLLVNKEEIPRILITAASAPGRPELCDTFKPVIPPCKDCDKEVIGLVAIFFVTSNVDTAETEFILFSDEKPVTMISSISSESELIDTVKLLMARETTCSKSLKPIYLNTNISPRLALILKYPLTSVTVPMVVPLIMTFTPANGTGGSIFSTTCPWIVHSRSSATLFVTVDSALVVFAIAI